MFFLFFLKSGFGCRRLKDSTACCLIVQSCDHNRIVFDSVNMAIRDEDSILDQIYKRKKKISDFSLRRFEIPRVIEGNAFLKKYSTLQHGTHKFGFCATPMLVLHFRIML